MEIYFDETGKNNEFRVGGLVILYPDEKTATDFSSAMRDGGIVWGWHRDDPWEPLPLKWLPKSSSAGRNPSLIKNTLAELQRLATDKIQVAAFSLGSPLGRGHSAWSGPDQMFRALLRDSIEMLLFEWIPRCLPNTNPEVGIYVATRRIPGSGTDLLSISRNFGLELLNQDEAPYTPNVRVLKVKDKDTIRKFLQDNPDENLAYVMHWGNLQLYIATGGKDEAKRRELENLGFENVKKLTAYSFIFDHLHPILAEVLGERPPETKRPTIAAGLGVRLKYYHHRNDLTPHQLPRQIHYASDWVIANPDLVPFEWRRGFWENRDEEFRHLLQACRNAERSGGAVDAVIEWSRASDNWRKRPIVWPSAGHDRPIIGKWAGERVADCLRRLKGEDFLRICERLHLESREQPVVSHAGAAKAPKPAPPSGKSQESQEVATEPKVGTRKGLANRLFVGRLNWDTTDDSLAQPLSDSAPSLRPK